MEYTKEERKNSRNKSNATDDPHSEEESSETGLSSSNGSLKFKIKLPGKVNASDASSPRQDNMEYTTESLENTPRTRSKKPELNSTNQDSSKPTLKFINFPQIGSENKLYQRAVSSTAPEGQLYEWNERDIAALKDELENMRHSLRNFSSSLQSQVDILENMKKTREVSSKTGTPTSSGRERNKPGNKRQKTGGEFGSDVDSPTYQYPGDEDSPPEDEINVGDVEDQFNPGSDFDIKSGKPSKGRGKGSKSRKKQINKKAAVPQTPTEPQPTTPQPSGSTSKYKGKDRKSGGGGGGGTTGSSTRQTRVRGKNKNNTTSEPEYFDGGDEDDFGKYGKSTFWSDMDHYFAAFAEADLKFCTPTNVDQDEVIVSIPPLGKHYKEIWAEEDNEEVERVKIPETPINDAIKFNSEHERTISCGDLTSRILSALIEENILPNNTHTTEKEVNGDLYFEQNSSKFLSSLPSVQGSHSSNANSLANDALNLPLDTPPTFDYSYAGMYSLEERIKMELKSIGLLDDDDVSNQREDDEVCSEIRKLQKQLRDRVVTTNMLKAKMHASIAASMQKEEIEKKERINNQNLEKSYIKLMRKKKSTRKTPKKEEIT